MNDMPVAPKTMAHSSRTEPYPIMSADSAPKPSTRPFASDFTSQASERASTAWSHDDDARLMQYRAQGMNWGPISGHFPSKTANACRKRHERLMEKKSVENWDGIKIEDLARAYLECRETMWKIMASHLGEKWQTVEMKCMEKGLKTLQTAGRAARRHSARQSSPDHSLRSASDFDEPIMGFQHSPASSHLPPPSLFTQGLAPGPSQARTGSLSSASSATGPLPQPTHSQPRYSYSSSQHHQPSLFSTATPAPSSYMSSSNYGNMTLSPTTTSGYQPSQSLPSFSRSFDTTSRSTQPPLPPMLPSLLTTSRSHQEPITASY